MSVDSFAAELLRDVPFIRDAISEGITEGRTEGLAEGLAEGRSGVLLSLLRARFGDDAGLPALAQRLAERPDEDAAVRAIMNATDLHDLT